LNRVTIITTTYYPDNDLGYQRYDNFVKCAESWKKNIKYDGHIDYHIADDGTRHGGIKIGDTKQNRKGVGASLNNGFEVVFKQSDIAMYIVDDWMLHKEIDITPWVDLLINNDNVGMVRLGPPHPDLTGMIKMFNEGFALVLDRHNYAYAMRPALYHKRFFETYGLFDEGISCWECERFYNERFCMSLGPEIVYAIPNPWEHIDTLALGRLHPIGGQK